MHAPTTTARDRILSHGLELASSQGLHAISISDLARDLELPRSGLRTHFETKERLQLAILEQAASLFQRDVIDASLHIEAGESRIEAMFANWIAWSRAPHLRRGCPFVKASAEARNLPPNVRERLNEIVDHWRMQLTTAIEQAKMRTLDENIDTDQMVFELYGLYLSHHFWHWSMQDPNAHARTMKAFARALYAAQRNQAAA